MKLNLLQRPNLNLYFAVTHRRLNVNFLSFSYKIDLILFADKMTANILFYVHLILFVYLQSTYILQFINYRTSLRRWYMDKAPSIYNLYIHMWVLYMIVRSHAERMISIKLNDTMENLFGQSHCVYTYLSIQLCSMK